MLDFIKKNSMKNYFLVFGLFLIIGCAGDNPTYDNVIKKTTQKQNLNEPKSWTSVKDNGQININWIKSFNDIKLEKLVKESLKNNRQIKSLQAQVESSKALVKQAASGLKPTVGLGGQYSSRNAAGYDEIYGGGLTASWEADIWGRLESSVSSAKQNFNATQSDYEFARQSLVGSVAKAWYMSINSKLQMQFANNIVSLLTKELEIMNAKYKVGIIDKRNVYLAKANLSSAKDAYLKSLTAYENSQRSLEILLGRYPSASIQSINKLVEIEKNIPVGIPSEILNRRPDLIAAQQRVASAFYKKREAELLKLPRFNFSIGANITNLTNAISDLGAGIFAPLYTGGAIESQVENATANQKKAIESYAQKALLAFKDVETALSQENKLIDQEGYLKEVVLDNKKAFELTKATFKVGKIEYLDVVQMRNRYISSEISLLNISSQRIFNRINLHLALGGGFEISE